MANWLCKICCRFCGCKEEAPIPVSGLDPSLSPEQRATYARQLKGNPVWDEVINNLSMEAYGVWAATKMADVEEREYLYKHFQIIGMIKRRIDGYISSAALDEHIQAQKAATPKGTAK